MKEVERIQLSEDAMHRFSKVIFEVDDFREIEALTRGPDLSALVEGRLHYCREVLINRGFPEPGTSVSVDPDGQWKPIPTDLDTEGALELVTTPLRGVKATSYIVNNAPDDSVAYLAAKAAEQCIELLNPPSDPCPEFSAKKALQLERYFTLLQVTLRFESYVDTGTRVRGGAARGGQMRGGRNSQANAKLYKIMRPLVETNKLSKSAAACVAIARLRLKESPAAVVKRYNRFTKKVGRMPGTVQK